LPFIERTDYNTGDRNEGKIPSLDSFARSGLRRGAEGAEFCLRQYFCGLLFFIRLLQKRQLLARVSARHNLL
jgi:hypothetical protein